MLPYNHWPSSVQDITQFGAILNDSSQSARDTNDLALSSGLNINIWWQNPIFGQYVMPNGNIFLRSKILTWHGTLHTNSALNYPNGYLNDVLNSDQDEVALPLSVIGDGVTTKLHVHGNTQFAVYISGCKNQHTLSLDPQNKDYDRITQCLKGIEIEHDNGGGVFCCSNGKYLDLEYVNIVNCVGTGILLNNMEGGHVARVKIFGTRGANSVGYKLRNSKGFKCEDVTTNFGSGIGIQIIDSESIGGNLRAQYNTSYGYDFDTLKNSELNISMIGLTNNGGAFQGKRRHCKRNYFTGYTGFDTNRGWYDDQISAQTCVDLNKMSDIWFEPLSGDIFTGGFYNLRGSLMDFTNNGWHPTLEVTGIWNPNNNTTLLRIRLDSFTNEPVDPLLYFPTNTINYNSGDYFIITASISGNSDCINHYVTNTANKLLDNKLRFSYAGQTLDYIPAHLGENKFNWILSPTANGSNPRLNINFSANLDSGPDFDAIDIFLQNLTIRYISGNEYIASRGNYVNPNTL